MFQIFQWLRRGGGGHEQSSKTPPTPASASLFPTSCVCGSLPNADINHTHNHNNTTTAEDLLLIMQQQQQQQQPSGASTPKWHAAPIPRAHIIKPRRTSGTTTPTIPTATATATATPARKTLNAHVSSARSGASTPRQHAKPDAAPPRLIIKPDIAAAITPATHGDRNEDSRPKAGPTPACSRNGSLSSNSSSTSTSTSIITGNSNNTSTSSTVLKLTGSIPPVDPIAVKSVSQESPPPLSRHARWLKMGMSRSGKATPNRGSISSLPDWNNIGNNDVEILVNEGEPTRMLSQLGQRGGTLSTMGSPWNSKAGHSSSCSFDHHSTTTSEVGGESHHQLYHNSYRRRRKYKQGHWVTTDTDYVVLEL